MQPAYVHMSFECSKLRPKSVSCSCLLLYNHDGYGSSDDVRYMGPCRWEALLVIMDSEPFRDVHYILQELNDDRVWVYAEWVRCPGIPNER